jgi:hypothetical protein
MLPPNARKTLPGTYNELWAQAWVDVVSHSTSGAFFSFRTSSGSSIVYVYVNSAGKLALRNDVGSVTTYRTTSMPTGGWHRAHLRHRPRRRGGQPGQPLIAGES